MQIPIHNKVHAITVKYAKVFVKFLSFRHAKALCLGIILYLFDGSWYQQELTQWDVV